MEIIDQQLKWNEETNECTLITNYSEGSLLSEPLTPEEAAQWQAENHF